MKQGIEVVLVVEDVLSEAVLRRLLRLHRRKFLFRATLGKEGFGFIQKNMPAFNKAAEKTGFMVLTDLDDHLCPQVLLRSWLPEPVHPNLMFRVAIREVEAWLLAHREAIARYLRVPVREIPMDSETIRDPKALMIELARESQSTEIRDALVPGKGRRRRVGPDYNGCLLRFVYRNWNPEEARTCSDSLDRAMSAIDRYTFRESKINEQVVSGESVPAEAEFFGRS